MATSSQPSESTSKSLLERAKANDPLAWQRLTHIYGPDVYRWARLSGMQGSDAGDIVQEVFQAVARNLRGFRKDRVGDAFRGWLWTISRNKIRDFFARQAKLPQAEGGSDAQRRLEQLPEAAPDSDADAGGQAASAALARRAMELMRTDFEERTWQAFWRTSIEDRPAADVADELDMSLAAIYQAKSRVLRRLRQELEGLDVVE